MKSTAIKPSPIGIVASLMMLVLGGCGGMQNKSVSAASMPPGGSFHGVWQSPQWGEMHLCVNDRSVVGDYEHMQRHGRIQGSIVGNLVKFKWEEEREVVIGKPNISRGHGYFKLKLGEDGDQYMFGEWGFDNDNSGGGEWNMVKLRKRKPEKCLAAESSRSKRIENDPDYSDMSGDDVEESSSDAAPAPRRATPTEEEKTADEALDDW